MIDHKIFYDDQLKTITLGDKQSIKLTSFEYQLFKKLIENINTYISSDDLVHYMWKDEAVTHKKDSSNLIQLVSKLRRQISIFDDILMIDGKRGVGYCLNVLPEYEILDKTNYSLSMLSTDLSTAFREDFKTELATKTTQFKFRDFIFVAMLSFFMASFYLSKQVKLPEVDDLSELNVTNCDSGIYISSDLTCNLVDKIDDKYSYIFSKYEDSILYTRIN